MRKSICISILFIFFHWGCNKENDVDKLDLNTLKDTWILEKFIDKNSNNIKNMTGEYYVGFTFHGENCIQVIGPCNSGPGKYQVSGNKIEITKLAMTEKGCDILQSETLFTSNLSGEYIINGNKLTVISDFNTDLILIRADSTRNYDCYDF